MRMIEGNEDKLTTALLRELRHRHSYLTVLHHRDITAGIPDLSVTGRGHTTWWELKHARPTFKSRGIQRLTTRRLAAGGHCYYIIYREGGAWGSHTVIVRPDAVTTSPMDAYAVTCVASIEGFDQRWVSDFIAGCHRDYVRP